MQQVIEPNVAGYSVTIVPAYDAYGNVASESVTGSGMTPRVSSTSYGAQGVFPVSMTNALGQVSSATWDYALGVPKSVTDPNQLTVNWQHDGFGRRTLETRPDSTQTRWVYSSCNSSNGYCGDGLLRYQVDQQHLDATANHGVIRYATQSFDSLGRVKRSQAQMLTGIVSTVTTDYDGFGRLARQSMPHRVGEPVYYASAYYDLIDRPIREERPVNELDGSLQETRFEYEGMLQTLIDANGKRSKTYSNVIGQTIRTVDALNGEMRYEYDPFGNLLKTIDPAANEIRNTFSIRGFRLTTRDPDMGSWTYVNNALGEMVTQTDAKNQTVTFTYDALSRPRTRVEPEGTTTFTYGSSAALRNIGRLQSVTSPGFQQSHTYDAFGRSQETTTTVESTNFVFSNTYNSITGLPETLTYPASTTAVPGSRFKVKFDYAFGRLNAVRDFNSTSTVYWQALQTNAAGRVTEELYGNGLRTLSEFDSVTGLLRSLRTGSNGAVQNLSYLWDKVGNLEQRKDESRSLTETFTYDDLYRMKESKLNGSVNMSVTYNAIGNISAKLGVGTYTYPASGTNSVRPHAVTTAGTNTYGYDANGNMNVRNGSAVTWTSYNLPSAINAGTSYSQFSYGADRQRWKQVANIGGVTETTVSIGGLFDRITRGTVTEYRHYIPGGGGTVIRTLRSTGTANTYYASSDHLGSADVVTNETGAILVRESFAAFGGRRGSNWTGAPTATEMNQIANISRDGFTGHEMLDSVGLIHMNGRVYDPTASRFMSADPFVQDPFDSQSPNRYSYVGNNPLSYTDPSGYFKLRDILDPSSKNFVFPVSGGITRAIDRFMIKNPKAATYVASAYGGWAGLGISAHLARINGASNAEIVGAGITGFFFAGSRYHYGLSKEGPSGSNIAWGANNGIAGTRGLQPSANEPMASGGGPGAFRTGASIGIGFIPFAGTIQSFVELSTGRDYITGEDTSRILAAAGIFAGIVPGGKSVLKGVSKALRTAGHSVPLEKQAADLVVLNGGKNRVTLRSEAQQLEVDLAGGAHNGIPTPHTKVSPRNRRAPADFQPAYNTSEKKSVLRQATQDDIRTARRYLERQ